MGRCGRPNQKTGGTTEERRVLAESTMARCVWPTPNEGRANSTSPTDAEPTRLTTDSITILISDTHLWTLPSARNGIVHAVGVSAGGGGGGSRVVSWPDAQARGTGLSGVGVLGVPPSPPTRAGGLNPVTAPSPPPLAAAATPPPTFAPSAADIDAFACQAAAAAAAAAAAETSAAVAVEGGPSCGVALLVVEPWPVAFRRRACVWGGGRAGGSGGREIGLGRSRQPSHYRPTDQIQSPGLRVTAHVNPWELQNSQYDRRQQHRRESPLLSGEGSPLC